MPISPYTGSVLYTGYTSGRPYTGAATASKVSRSDIGLPFKLSSSNSSSAVKSSPFGSAPFLTGNTAALKKTFSEAFVPGVSRVKEKTSPSGSFNSSSNYNGTATDNKYTSYRNSALDDIKEISNRPNKYEGGLYVNRYSNLLMAKSNAEREKSLKPIEIDASRINVSGKPPRPSINYNAVKRFNDNESSISRNRQVVRLTIKREKEKIPYPLYDSSVKTIAQKLLEKYTVHEKKKEEPVLSVPRNRWLTVDAPKVVPPVADKPPKSPERSQTSTNIKANTEPAKCSTVGKSKSCYAVDDGHDGDDELSSDDDESSSSDESSSEETSSWLVRANRAASMTRELRNKEDVKDAIVAAVLNPAVDIESDEEMKQLVEDDENLSERRSQKHNENTLAVKQDLLDKRKKLEPEIGGEIIVDRLKRFVKQQVTIKKESLKRSKKISPKKEVKDNIINKTKERIIPIIMQDDYLTTNKRKSDKKEETNSKTCKIIPICLEDRQNEESFPSKLDKMQILNDSNEAAKSLPKVSLLLNERETTIKCQKKSLAKSSSPVYQTTLGESLEALPVAFQTSSLVSGEHSITQPENKVPATSSFISDLVSDSKEHHGKEFLSLSSSAGKGVKTGLEAKTPTPLTNIKTTQEIVKEQKDAEKCYNKILSELDNSIRVTSSKLKRDEKGRISDRIDDSKSNYRLSDEIAGKKESDESDESSEEEEFDKIRIKNKEIYSKRAPLHLPEENVETSRREPKTESSYADWNESHVSNPITHFDQDAKKECPLSSPKEANYVDSSPTNKLIISSSRLFQKGSLENLSNESNSLQETWEKHKTEANKNDIKPFDKNMTNISKKYDLKKSATTQIATGSQNVELKTNVCHDAESISYNDDADIKPSLRQFLEDSRTDMKNYKENESNQEASVATKPISKLGKISESPIQEETQETAKKAIKRPRQVNQVVAEKVETKLAPNVNELTKNRVILKRPVKAIPEGKPGATKLGEEIKPKRVWKKPAPPVEVAKPTNEYLKILNQLKTVKVKNDADKSKSKDEIIKTVKEVKLKKRPSKEKTDAKSDGPNITSEGTKSGEGKISIELQSDKEKISDVFDKKSRNETEPNKSSDAKPSIKRSKKKSSNTENSENVIENISSDIKTYSEKVTERFSEKDSEKESDKILSKSALSTSHSADSAYGSSPSTPQPRPVEKPEVGATKEESKSREGSKSNKQETVDENYKCEMCGTNCHKKCEKQMPNLCGVNQKLLAEALSSVKKGSSTDGRDVFRTLNAAAASKSISSVSSTEGDSTTTDDDETDTDCSEYSGPAEIRPPITTRPKYKKYTIEDFNFIKVLGKGSFGKVMLAQQIATENYFAVKCLKKDVVLEDNDVECCLIERKVLTLGTKHPYLCHLFCSFQTPSHLFFVMEYLTGGDLMFHIQHVGRFDEYRACFYAAEITSGLKFLHSKGIIYRDLKLDNILLDYEGHIRIADFGMCKLQIYYDKFADTFCGTPDYMAPEVIKGAHYNQCVDWWSFGVLMYEMMTGKSPFKGCDEDHLFWLICNEEPFYPRFLSREAQSILKQLLDKDSTRRLGPPYSPYGEIKEHQFFKYVDWNKIERKEVETPYKPRLRHILDVQYFDRLFTKRNATLTPLDDSILETMDQTPFKDFSYTNPNITD